MKKGNKVVEYLPPNCNFSKNGKRDIFFKLYKYYVDESMRLSSTDIQNGKDIYEVFKNKLQDKNISKRLITFIINSQESMFFDLDDMFLHLVYERVKRVNPNSFVSLMDNMIEIRDDASEATPTLLYVSYLKLDKRNFFNNTVVKQQVENLAKKINETDIKQIFLVYPKQDDFKKHITLNLLEKVRFNFDEYRVKIVPYSFSFCINKKLRGERRCA